MPTRLVSPITPAALGVAQCFAADGQYEGAEHQKEGAPVKNLPKKRGPPGGGGKSPGAKSPGGKRGGASKELPPGWSAIRHDGPSSSYTVYQFDETGKRARSIVQAWKMHQEGHG